LRQQLAPAALDLLLAVRAALQHAHALATQEAAAQLGEHRAARRDGRLRVRGGTGERSHHGSEGADKKTNACRIACKGHGGSPDVVA
jgi:hypothetical protein